MDSMSKTKEFLKNAKYCNEKSTSFKMIKNQKKKKPRIKIIKNSLLLPKSVLDSIYEAKNVFVLQRFCLRFIYIYIYIVTECFR